MSAGRNYELIFRNASLFYLIHHQVLLILFLSKIFIFVVITLGQGMTISCLVIEVSSSSFSTIASCLPSNSCKEIRGIFKNKDNKEKVEKRREKITTSFHTKAELRCSWKGENRLDFFHVQSHSTERVPFSWNHMVMAAFVLYFWVSGILVTM